MKKITEFIKKETVLCIAFLLALVSAFIIPPDEGYIGYVDFRTLAILFCLMSVMAGLQKQGVFGQIARKLLGKVKSGRGIVLILVMLCFFFSMLITNDVALITFVPFTFTVLGMLGEETGKKMALPVVVMQTIAANLGSMLTPIGNPQNLYLFGKAGMSIGGFFLLMLPYAVLSLVLLLGWAFVQGEKCMGLGTGAGEFRQQGARSGENFSAQREQGSKEKEILQGQGNKEKEVLQGQGSIEKNDLRPEENTGKEYSHQQEQSAGNEVSGRSKGIYPLIIYLALFLLCLLVVAHILPWQAVLAADVVMVAATDWKVFGKVDYSLLLTFVGFFVFIGNMGRIPVFRDFLQDIIVGREVYTAVIASQAISNVPAALLLSGFTGDYAKLIVGTNLGGLGTLIASMASLISYKYVAKEESGRKGEYIKIFTVANVCFLAALLVLDWLIPA